MLYVIEVIEVTETITTFSFNPQLNEGDIDFFLAIINNANASFIN